MSYPANPTLVEKIEAHYPRLGESWRERRKLVKVVLAFEDGTKLEIIPRRVLRAAHRNGTPSSGNGTPG